MATKKSKAKNNEPFELTLWKSSDFLRKNIDAAEYKHVVLGLVFLKYISDENNVFYIPKKARWKEIEKHARSPEIGKKKK